MSEATIFAAALEKPDPAERAAYLDAACAGDAGLRRRVEELLAVHDRAGDYLERPAPEQLTAEAGLDFLQPSDRPGSLGRFADYEVEAVLSRSPYGAVVLRAFDTRLHRVVAIKLLTAAAGGITRERFLREARAAAAVRDDHVVALHAVADGPGPYLVMEYIAGQTLQHKLDQAGPLELREVLRIGMQIARGLAAIHAQGLIHRDIKPANILLENGIERVKITDFGLARAVDDANASQPGTVAGTPTYMSPEQAQGAPVDPRSDLFSLGSVLYALCTGRPPFRAADTLAVLRRVVDDVPRPVREVNPAIPAWLSERIARLHAKRPADRPQTAREVADRLAGQLAALQLPGGAPPARRPARRRRWVAAAVVLLALAGLGMAEGTGMTQLSGTVIRLFDPHGTLVLETDDPDVSVTVDGKELIIKGAGPREVRLRAGPHQVEMVRDGHHIDSEKVVIERGGRVIVRAHREPPAKAVPPPAAPPALPAPKEAAMPPAPGTVSAAALLAAMRDNAASYTGRHVIVTGRLARITGGESAYNPSAGWGWGRTYHMEMWPDGTAPAGGVAPSLRFYFFVPDKAASPLAALKTNDPVTVEGDCTGLWPKEPKAGEPTYVAFSDARLVRPGGPAPEQATTAVKEEPPIHGLARWVLSVGGAVRVLVGAGAVNPQSWWVNPKDPLPTNFDTLTAINLGGCKQVTDQDVGRITLPAALTRVGLEYVPITNAGLAKVVQARALTDLDLRGSGVGDGAIPLLAKLPKLTALDLSGTKLTTAGLTRLDELGRVSVLGLADLPLTDAEVPRLAELSYLFDLDLSGTKIIDAGVRPLTKLGKLQNLKLSRTALTDASLETLAGLQLLSGLYLDGTRITGSGLGRLAALEKLQVLSLAEAPLTDAGLAELAAVKSLRTLNLQRAPVSPGAVARLRRALPECQVNSE